MLLKPAASCANNSTGKRPTEDRTIWKAILPEKTLSFACVSGGFPLSDKVPAASTFEPVSFFTMNWTDETGVVPPEMALVKALTEIVRTSSGFLVGPMFIVSVFTVETEREEAETSGAEPSESTTELSLFSHARNVPTDRTKKRKYRGE